MLGPTCGGALALIGVANRCGAPVLSLDVSSGVYSSTGEVPRIAVVADATTTFTLPKTGLSAPTATPLVDELYLADIGVPPELLARRPLSLTVGPIFAGYEIIRLR